MDAKHKEQLDLNCAALKEHRAELWADLEPYYHVLVEGEASDDNRRYSIEPGPLATYNLRIDTPDGKLRVYSTDGISEAHLAIRNTLVGSTQLGIIFGMGLGYLIREIYENKPKNLFGIFVIEKNPEIFLNALCVFDFTKIIATTSAWFAIGKTEAEMKYLLVRFFESFTTVSRNFKILRHQYAVTLDTDYYNEIARYIMYARDQSVIWSGNSVEDSFHGVQNVCANLERLIKNPGIEFLKQKFVGKTCISLAAGPGANEAWDVLKRVAGKIPIIACDTMLKPLNQHGVEADIITALERDPIVADMFRGQKIPERSTLIGPSLLIPDALECYEGRQLLYSAAPPYSSHLGLATLGVLSPGSSAGNLNLALACWMGFSKIILIGHNLAFAPGSHESHVKGTIDPEREKTKSDDEIRRRATGGKVPTADGTTEVYTIAEYNLFRAQIENLIGTTPLSTFINTTAKGAKINGAEFKPLEEALQECWTEDLDFHAELNKLLQARTASDDRLKKVSEKLETALRVGEEFLKDSSDLVDKLKEWSNKIKAADESSSPVEIEWLNECLDKVLKLKTKAVNESPEFNAHYITIMSPAHIAFEREINEYPLKYDDRYKLKRDFLLRHLWYFEFWNRWIPKIREQYEQSQKRLVEASKNSVASDVGLAQGF